MSSQPKIEIQKLQERWGLKDHASFRHAGLAVPGWFKPDSMNEFRKLDVQETDVIMVSYPKCGTTWVHQILYCLLRMDDEGNFTLDIAEDPASDGQLYPDGLPMERPAEKLFPFGFASLKGLKEQSQPRLFSTHLPPPMLPTEGLRRSGRLVYVMRNPKDCLTSFHFFIQQLVRSGHMDYMKPRMAEGWMGDDAQGTLGSYGRFNSWGPDISSDSFGSYYWHVRSMGELIDEIGQSRATVVYYEGLHEDFDAELSRLASFLGVSLSDRKLSAIRQRVALDSMKASVKSGSRPSSGVTLRKGVVGDHREYITPEHWAQMDAWFDERLGDVAIAKPLRQWM